MQKNANNHFFPKLSPNVTFWKIGPMPKKTCFWRDLEEFYRSFFFVFLWNEKNWKKRLVTVKKCLLAAKTPKLSPQIDHGKVYSYWLINAFLDTSLRDVSFDFFFLRESKNLGRYTQNDSFFQNIPPQKKHDHIYI